MGHVDQIGQFILKLQLIINKHKMLTKSQNNYITYYIRTNSIKHQRLKFSQNIIKLNKYIKKIKLPLNFIRIDRSTRKPIV